MWVASQVVHLHTACPYAALCIAISTEDLTAKPQRMGRTRRATLHRAA
jgi:hypothetical protein